MFLWCISLLYFSRALFDSAGLEPVKTKVSSLILIFPHFHTAFCLSPRSGEAGPFFACEQAAITELIQDKVRGLWACLWQVDRIQPLDGTSIIMLDLIMDFSFLGSFGGVARLSHILSYFFVVIALRNS